ncbi:transposase [Bacillus sp. FSL H8-0534]|uniref:transposase n=1 Tax=Bacillus sp. FSL H8-0534 TaxID=2921398 RepID=UPI0030F64533
MQHVIAFDVSMGKSYMVIYNAQKQCIFESEINHSKPDFEELRKRIDQLMNENKKSPHIVFEATGVYSRQLERFMQDNKFEYFLLNPLEAKLQCDSLRIHKTDRSDAHQLALTHFTASRREKTGTDNLFYQLKSLSRFYSELDDVLCEQLKSYAKRYQELLHQKEQCITKMVRLAESRTEYPIILSFPGIGPNTAIRLLAEIGDITRFENNKQLNAFAGIDIRRFQSGKTFFKDKINKRGNKHLRKLLFLIIQNMIKLRRYGQNHIVEYYDKLKTQPYNKCHKVASIACVNKLLKLLFYLITHNIHYDYRLTA